MFIHWNGRIAGLWYKKSHLKGYPIATSSTQQQEIFPILTTTLGGRYYYNVHNFIDEKYERLCFSVSEKVTQLERSRAKHDLWA